MAACDYQGCSDGVLVLLKLHAFGVITLNTGVDQKLGSITEEYIRKG